MSSFLCFITKAFDTNTWVCHLFPETHKVDATIVLEVIKHQSQSNTQKNVAEELRVSSVLHPKCHT